MSDKEFIEKFRKITVAKVCRELEVNYYNVSGGRAGYDTTKKVAKTIQEKLNRLLREKNKYDKKVKEIID